MDRLGVRGSASRSSTASAAGARLSPVPGAANGVSFPTVLEEPTGYAGDEGGRGHHHFVENGFPSSHHNGHFGDAKSQQQMRAQHWRRPLMCGDNLSSEHTGRNNRSSRSFDSGMSYLVPESASPSPPPPHQIPSHHGDHHNLFHGIPEPMGSPLLSGGGGNGNGGVGRYSNFLTTPPTSTTSPMTPPMRSPHRLYSTTMCLQRSFSTTCPQPPPQPLSPTFKSRSFVSRRLSDHVTPSAFTSSLSQDPYSPMLRTLSPTISRSSTISASKSPSPCFSSRSSPIQQRRRNNSSPHNSSASASGRPGSGGGRGILAASGSLHSNDSEDGGCSSPQNAASPTAIGSSASPSTPTPTTSSSSSSYLRGSGSGTGRRMLPETPKMSSLEFPVSPSSSSFSVTATAPKQLPSFGPPPTSERNLAWQSLPSHDSLDSGVYSRSTTSDSNNGGGGGGSSRGAMTSPLSNGRDPSPPSFMRQQFRRIGARLPDLPDPAAAVAATQIPLRIGSPALERRKSAPPNKSSDLFAVNGVNGVSERGSNVNVTSSPHRAFSRHYYHYSCYAAEAAGKASSAAHLRDAGFSPTGARGHRVHFNTFMDGAAGAEETEEAQVFPGRGGGGGGANSSPLLSPSSLQIAQSNSVPAETPAYCDYADVGEPEIDDDGIVETHEVSTLIGAAVTTTTEELFYTNTEEDEELLADVDDDDDAFFVNDGGGYSVLANGPLSPSSPPPEALKNSSNREIAQVVNRRIRAMLTQDYSSAAADDDAAALEELPSRPTLDVPKLRDLKSHSFPPPWSRLTEEEEDADAYVEAPEQRPVGLIGPLVIADPLFFMGSDAAAARLADMCPSSGGESPQAEERRRRWLLHNHAVSCSEGVARNKEECEKDPFDAAIAGAHQG